MKFSYSLLQKLVPKLPAKQKLAETLSLYSFEVEEIKGDTLEISLPSNRYSDAASHIGIAREAAAAFKTPFVSPVKTLINLPSKKGLLKVEVKEKGLCPRYSARLFELGKFPSTPLWMKKALLACGVNSINGIVDIMNYAMLETGQPLHAFDAEKIAKGIVVRRAEKKEKIETLDGAQHELSPETLVIADHTRALAIAGIKGGMHSGVSKETKKIIVEAANFESVSIFKTSKSLGLITDASVRFGHGLSPALVDWGLDRATELLKESGATILDSADVYPEPVGSEIIAFSTADYEKLIGVSISLQEAENGFKARGFTVHQKKKDSLLIKIPPWRTDMEIKEDLIEELARLRGYGSLKPEPPRVSLIPAMEDDSISLKERARTILSGMQMDEVYNYTFVGNKEPEMLGLQNPISQEFAYLRKSLEGGLLKNVETNGRFFEEIRIFEIGNIFKAGLRQNTEETHLGLCLAKKKEIQALEMKGIIRELLAELGLTDFMTKEEKENLRIESDHKVIGEVKVVHLEKNWVAVLAELNLTKILGLVEEEKEYRPLSRFPSVVRDVSMLVDSYVRIGEILELMQNSGAEYAEDIDLIDEYTDEKMLGEQSLTFRIVFQAEDRTLTDSEANKDLEKMIAAVRAKHHLEIR